MSGGHDDQGAEGANIEAPKALSVMGYGEGCPLPSRLGGLGERRELPQQGPGQSPGRIAFFVHILGHRTLLVARKIRFSCPKYKKKWYFYMKICIIVLRGTCSLSI